MRYVFLLIATLVFSQSANAHCEIPCGVFDDGARFDAIEEHARTIEKAMVEINRLSALDVPDYHTIARWAATKEEHANKVQQIASVYFLTQRVKKPADDADDVQRVRYVKHLTQLHELLVAAMKTKQSTDTARVEALLDANADYKAHYFNEHGHSH